MTFLSALLDVKMIGAFLSDTVEVVEDTQTLLNIKLRTLTAELAEMGNHIVADTVEIGAGVVDIFLADGYRDVLVLHH